MATEADIQKRIAEEQAKIQVPSYQDVAFDGAWKRRSSAMWGIPFVAAAMGALVGIGAPLFLAATPEITLAAAAALIPKSLAIFSAIGITSGWAVGTLVGTSSGGAASAMKEYERRQLARGIEGAIRENLDATVTLGETLVENKKTNLGISRYFNWKTSLLFAGIGALGAVVFATALAMTGGAGAAIPLFAMPAMELLIGKTATAAAATAYTLGVGTMVGALFGINAPLLARDATNWGGEMLSGRAIGAPWPDEANLPDLKPILSPVVTSGKAAPIPSMEIPVEGKHCAACAKDKPQFKGYEDLVNRSIAEASMAR